MPKHSYSSSKSSSSNHKKHKIDSLCSHCSSSSSNKKYIDCNCKDYFHRNGLIHTSIITELDANEYLELRKTKFAELDTFELKKEEEDCIVINPIDNSVKINDILIQQKNITISNYISNGCYGVIFVSSPTENITYVMKFIINNKKNKNEIITMIDIKKNNNTHIPNFINIAYYHLNCRKISNSSDNVFLNGISQCLKDNNYTMIILEYFDGTIFELINKLFPLFPVKKFNSNEKEIFNSIFAQLIISIYLFHNKFNYFHNDTHLSNFLYKKVIPDEKYFHYKIGDNDYYIKNCGYVVVLSDYGLSIKILTINKNKLLKDYGDILYKINLFLKKRLSIIDENIIKTFTHYNDMSNQKNKDTFNEDDFFYFIMTSILNIKTTKSDDMILINEYHY